MPRRATPHWCRSSCLGVQWRKLAELMRAVVRGRNKLVGMEVAAPHPGEWNIISFWGSLQVMTARCVCVCVCICYSLTPHQEQQNMHLIMRRDSFSPQSCKSLLLLTGVITEFIRLCVWKCQPIPRLYSVLDLEGREVWQLAINQRERLCCSC